MARTTFVLVLLFFCLGQPTFLVAQKATKTIEIRGVYGNPKPLWEKGHNLKTLGVNSIFVHSGAITHEMVNRAKSEEAKIFAEFATLNGKNYVDEHPEAWAINQHGGKVEAATWFMGVCPTEPGFRNYRMNQLRELLTTFELDGVWMDYVHWHAQFEDPEPILPETCFSDSCLKTFSEDLKIELPDGTVSQKATWILKNKEREWRDWRCEIIASWAKDIKLILKEIRPNALLGLYHCPWTDEEFDNARRRILGLDFDLLKQTVDVFSPMVYHGRMERKPTWVAENVTWLCDKLNIKNNTYPKVWPIVQAHNDPGIIPAKEFSKVLNGGLASHSSGVMMFTTNSVAEDNHKIEVMRKLYRSIDSIQSSN